jgi:hypothetical protein
LILLPRRTHPSPLEFFAAFVIVPPGNSARVVSRFILCELQIHSYYS